MIEDPRDVCVITGASRGIGRLLALHLSRAGSRVLALARPSDDLTSLADDADATRLSVTTADVTDPVAVGAAFEAVVNELGPPTNVFTCAGSIDALGPIAEVDPDRWWSAVAVDLRGTMLVAQAALRSMLPRGRGRIITVYGNLGDRGAPNLSAFAAAKAGIARFTETLANEVRDSGVTVLGIHPGFVRTPMTERLAWSEEGRRWLPAFARHAEQHWGTGETATQLLDAIVSGAADTFSGRIIHAGDNLEELAERASRSDDVGRLRYQQ